MCRSLLTYTKQDSTFRHYNSAKGMNEEAAMSLAENAWKLLGCELKQTKFMTLSLILCGLKVLGDEV